MRIKRPDAKNAMSIIQSAKEEIDFTLSLKITNASASTIARNIYESFRMFGEALLVAQGFHTSDHVEPVKKLMELPIETQRPLALIDSYRKTRHNINNYGYRPSISEVKDMIDFANKCFTPIYSEVKSIIEK